MSILTPAWEKKQDPARSARSGKRQQPGLRSYTRRAERWRQLVLLPFSIALLYPLLWLASASFKSEEDIFSTPIWELDATLENFIQGWTGAGQPFHHFLINSFVIAALSTLGTVLSSAFVGYAFARLNFPLRKVAFGAMIATIMLPGQVTMIPQYTIFRALGFVDTYVPLILPDWLATKGFYIFLFMQFIRGIPRELDESARIDGCGPIRIFFTILLPLMKPALVTASVMTFIASFDDFMGQLIYISSPEKYTTSIALRIFVDITGSSSFGQQLAMSLVSVVPIIVVFLVLQRHITQGISTTGIK